MLAVNDKHFTLSNIETTEFTVSSTITMKADNISWTLTGVYGPQTDQDKFSFMEEIKNIKNTALNKWLIIGDFNLIYRVEDKNNNRLDHRLMSRFK